MWIIYEWCGQPKYSVTNETCQENKRRMSVKWMTFEHVKGNGQHKHENCAKLVPKI